MAAKTKGSPANGEEMAAPVDAAMVADDFRVISDPTRLRILLEIGSSANGEISAGKIGETLGVSGPTTSHHLSKMKDARFVKVRRGGKSNFYSLAPKGEAAAAAARVFWGATNGD